MKKLEYLQSVKGQMNSRCRRIANRGYFTVNQEPKSKNSITQEEKIFFRREIVNQLKERNKRAYRKDVILSVDFWITKKNAPAIHSLAKNYLDLLHKELLGVDSHSKILFKDDNQVKILIINYHINLEDEIGKIYIQTQSIGDLVKDLELADSLDLEEENNYPSEFDTSLESLRELEQIKHIVGKNYENLKRMWTQQVQKDFLKLHNIRTFGLISLFRSRFSSHNKFSKFPDLKDKLMEFERLIVFSTNFLELGQSPQQEGETRIFKDAVKVKLNEFKVKYKLLFPLTTPIRVNILFIPPKSNIADLDNIARYIIPFVNEVFHPPLNLQSYFDKSNADENESKSKPLPPNSISGYQIITIPRKETDDENGQILFVISDGLFTFDLWWEMDEIIDKWKER